jgi:hypothetical protein
MIDSNELDKYSEMFIDFSPQLDLKLRQDIYTFLLRCVDLNISYTDNLKEMFNFSKDEYNFSSLDHSMKLRTVISTDYLALSLINKGGEQMTQLGLKKPKIIIE